MFLLIWATVVLAVRGNNTTTVASPGETQIQGCKKELCISFSEAENTAVDGLCVAIQCSFTANINFTLQSIVWYKCDLSKQNCSDSEIILDSKNNSKARPGFSGRVFLLEPELSHNNCSIIINNLTMSDTGSYQLRINVLLNGTTKAFSDRTTINVSKGLTQKPKVTIPPLMAGQQTTLTCTAPGLCSGSDPKINWMWRGAGEKDSHITGNVTANQGQTSTLTFNVSAEHHGSEVTCKVSFTGNRTTGETVTLNVTYAKTLEINGNTAVKEGGALNLSCSIESFPPSLITWSELHSDISLHSNNGTANLVILNVTEEDSGQYVCTAVHLNETLKEKVNVTVEYVKKPQITGNTTVKEGDALNLTCSFDGFPPSVITWTKLGSNKNLKNGTGAATLTIFNVTAEHAGQYICTAKHLNATLTTYANVTVALCPTILNSSGCMRESKVLTCVCVSEGSPLPTIKWPLLVNHTEYTVITTVSNHTVNSTIILTIKDHRNTDVKCVSDNRNGRLQVDLIIKNVEEEKEDQSMKMLRALTRLEMIIAFLIGGLLSAILCCLGRQCCRKKQRTSRKLDETLEMVISQEGPLIVAGPAVEDDLIHNREGAEGGRAVEAEKSDLEYSDINFSVLKRKNSAKAANSQVNTDTEYAEIKKEAAEERQDEEEMQEDMMMGDDEEAIQCMQEETEGEDVALYSNVKDIMG